MKRRFNAIKPVFFPIFSIFLPLFTLIFCPICHAESINDVINPKVINNTWVSDMAGVISDETKNQMNLLINELEKTTSAEIVVVTVQSVDNSTPKEFATNLFNLWKVGDRKEDNGILVLLVMDERRIEVETGYGIEGVLPDGKVGEILRDQVVPHFKKDNYGKGLLAGVQEMANIISGDNIKISDKNQKIGTKPPGIISFMVDWIFSIFTFLIIAFWLAIIYFIWRHFNYHRCPECKKRMRKLTEQQEDVYLTDDQKFEEELGSMDYHVWRCDDCQINKIEKTKKGYGKFEECPKCKHRTVYIKSVRIKEPTASSKGLEEITKKCKYPKCGYIKVSTKEIPAVNVNIPLIIAGTMVGRSSSGSSRGGSRGSWGGGSSGGSFGGGSSGGGGAGASW